ncbi:hypothetical protein BY996DRAFT_8047131 [Phakopsora pachyrhizi]|nr:hypothetical protein BY996DRAFT_8047131 [Phakopsora pachyrhizi]
MTSCRRQQLIGLLRGMINFSSLLAIGLEHQEPSSPLGTTNLRSIRSLNQIILFQQPEPNLIISAVINVPSSSSHLENSNHQQNSLTTGQGHNDRYHHHSEPSDQCFEPYSKVLLNELRKAYLEYQILNGSISSQVDDRRRLSLELFWNAWIRRWDLERSGCGIVDFDEYFGSLESPMLNLSKTYQNSVKPFNRFLNQRCSPRSVLPILLHRRQILYNHCSRYSDKISQDETNALIRHLLSHLLTSDSSNLPVPESRKQSSTGTVNGLLKVPVQQLTNLKRLGSILNNPFQFGPDPTALSTSPSPSSSSSSDNDSGNYNWAKRALAWASSSLLVPTIMSQTLMADEACEESIEDLNEQLRNEFGLSNSNQSNHHTQPQQQRLNISYSRQNFTKSKALDPILIINQNDDSQGGALESSSPCLSYPDNLFNIYPTLSNPKESRDEDIQPCSSGGDDIRKPFGLDRVGSELVKSSKERLKSKSLTKPHSSSDLRKTEEKRNCNSKKMGGSLGSNQNKNLNEAVYDPRSPRFNVEHALADAMADKNRVSRVFLKKGLEDAKVHKPKGMKVYKNVIGDEEFKKCFTERDGGLDMAGGMVKGSASKVTGMKVDVRRIKLFVQGGKDERNVIWLQSDDWTLALIDLSDDADGEDGVEELVNEGCELIGTLEWNLNVNRETNSTNNLPSTSSTSQRPVTTSRSTKKNDLQKFLIRSLSRGTFLKNSARTPAEINHDNLSDKNQYVASGEDDDDFEGDGWMGKDEIWSGRRFKDDDLEFSQAILDCDNQEICNKGHEEMYVCKGSGRWVGYKKKVIKAVKEPGIKHVKRNDKSNTNSSNSHCESCHTVDEDEDQAVERNSGGQDEVVDIYFGLAKGVGSLIEVDSEVRRIEDMVERRMKFGIV